MKWSRELKIARRSLRTAVKAGSAIAKAQMRLPGALQVVPWSVPDRVGGIPNPIEIPNFGSNPGRLSMLVHVPAVPPAPGAPLIIVLHGCGQAATTFACDAGWMAFADQTGVPLVLPEQSGDNNHGRCFNWFRTTHVSRGFGEALSIRQMIAAATQHFSSDPNRIYVVGLSAGGAMTAALLAAYPDVFAAGAVVAGLPVGAASSTSEALRRMAEAGHTLSPTDWANRVRRAGPVGFSGPWPRLSIWHGEADNVVDPANAALIAVQWSTLHGIDQTSSETVELPGARLDRWNHGKRPMVERWSLPGLTHVWPSHAIQHIAAFWGIGADQLTRNSSRSG
jgi:poly(hydroxyalkanoate) depolymerase family esterase